MIVVFVDIGIHGVGAVTALEVLSMFNMTPQKDGETTETVSILSSLRKFRDWWQHKSPTQRVPTLRNKLKNITITEDFPNPRVCSTFTYLLTTSYYVFISIKFRFYKNIFQFAGCRCVFIPDSR